MPKLSRKCLEYYALMKEQAELYQRVFKPCLDFALAALALIVLLPIILVTALAILIEDGRPIFFVHERIGRNGGLFRIYKFRSMSKDAEILPSIIAGSLRVTKVGAIIRRLNVDELPQLLNVLNNEMSIVGPRPALPSQMQLHNARRENGSSALKPGLTGLAQIKSYDGMSTQHKAKWDGEYARYQSFWLDIKIMFLTVGYLFRRQPTY